MKKERNLAFDLLRIIAAFSVIMLHSAAQFWYDLPVDQKEWQIANAYDACFRFGVPIFVMISGALFLGREQNTSISKLLKHNVLRLVIVYFLWSSIYGLWDCYSYGIEKLGRKEIVNEMLSGRYHLWFVPMIVGLYVICPIVYELVHRVPKRCLDYFVVLFLITEILRCSALPFIYDGQLRSVLNSFQPPLVSGYVGYFVLGYYLHEYGVSSKIRNVCLGLCIPALFFNVYMSRRFSLAAGTPKGEVYDCFCIGTFIIIIALFVGINDFCKGKKPGKLLSGIVKELSADTFGVYLMHLLILEFFRSKGIHVMSINIALGIPVMAIFVFVVGCVLAAILRRIPLLGRFIC